VRIQLSQGLDINNTLPLLLVRNIIKFIGMSLLAIFNLNTQSTSA
jgi:hypothetical protein